MLIYYILYIITTFHNLIIILKKGVLKMKKKISKIIIFTLLIAMSFNFMSPSASVLNKEGTSSSISSDLGKELISKDLVEKADKYVTIKDGKFILKNDIYNEVKISREEIKQIELTIKNTNANLEKSSKNIINNNNNKSMEVSYSNEEVANNLQKAGYDLEKDFNITNDTLNSRISTYASSVRGVNKVVFYWWGYYLYLNSYLTGLALTVTAGVLTAMIVAAIPEASPITIGVSTSIITYVITTLPIVQTGCVVSVNYLLGVQDIWAQ